MQPGCDWVRRGDRARFQEDARQLVSRSELVDKIGDPNFVGFFERFSRPSI